MPFSKKNYILPFRFKFVFKFRFSTFAKISLYNRRNRNSISILQYFNYDKRLKSMEVKTVNPKETKKQMAKELRFSDSSIEMY